MHGLSMTVKIWLSVGVFILGYTISVGLNQLQGHSTRTSLQTASAALFPAAQKSQQAEASFQREVAEFGNAAVTQDASGVDKAVADGQDAVSAIKSIVAIQGIPEQSAKDAGALASTLDQLLADSQSTYKSAMSGTMTPETQEQMRGLAARTTEATAALTKFKEQSAEDLNERLSTLGDQSANQSTTGLLLFLATLVIAGIIVHLTIHRSITSPISQAVSELSESARQIAGAASQVAGSSQALAQGSSQQAASLEETSSSSEHINSMARKNTHNADTMTELVTASQVEFAEANQHLGMMVTAMDEIYNSSTKISKIIKMIDEIAFQTNILALNAAVEAARAGEAGMGFAVVADEVRNLAQRSAQAAQDTAALIEESIDKADSGKTKVGQVAASIRRITGESEKIRVLVDEVSTGSKEQSDGIGQIGRALSQMGRTTQDSAASAQQSAAAAQEMSAQSESLEDIVKRLDSMVFG